MGRVIDGKLRVFAFPNAASHGDAGAIPVGACWPGRHFTPADENDAMQQVLNESPEYYLVRYNGLNDLIRRVHDLLESETWTAGNPPVVHHHPCLEILEITSHANPHRCGGICNDNLRAFATAIDGLRCCDLLQIYLSGCNTGCRDANAPCIAELLAQNLPSLARVRQYRCIVYGAKGYQSGTYAGKDSKVSKDTKGPKGEVHPPYEHSDNAQRDPASARDDSYQGYIGPNSA